MSKPSLQQGSGSLSETTFRDSHNSEVSLKLSIERVATTVTEIAKEVHPLLEQANNLASAVEKQNKFLETWLDFLKEGSTKLATPTETKD